ncbi:MAG: hypothetical protein LBL01_07770, partial [Bifidobacteriaceae bacterium]|nr:hypothetical protein [Bifidobacteriaceae bacterium]
MLLGTTAEAAPGGPAGAVSAAAAGRFPGPRAEDLGAVAAEAARREREDAAWVERMLKAWETDPEASAPWPADAGGGGWEDGAYDEGRWDPDDMLEAWLLEGEDGGRASFDAGEGVGPVGEIAAAARAAVAGLPRAEAGEALFAGFRAAFGEWAEAGGGVRDNLGAAELLTRAQRWAESAAARALSRAELDAPLEGQDRRNAAEEHGLRTAQTLFEARRLARAGRAGLGFPEIREAQDAGVFPAASCDAVMSAARRVAAAEARAEVVGFGIRTALLAPPSKLRAG